MNFLHTEFQGGSDHVVIVTLDHQANVMLLDDTGFSAYRSARRFHYYGGWSSESLVRLRPPRHGRWHVVVDLGGGAGTVRASVQVVKMNHGALA